MNVSTEPEAVQVLPLFFWGGTERRPMQPFLNKLPAQRSEFEPLDEVRGVGSCLSE